MYKKLGVGIEKGRYIDALRVFYKYRGCLTDNGFGYLSSYQTFTVTPPRSRWLQVLLIQVV